MRSIFSRLFLSFSLTILLTGLISGLVMFSLSRRSVETFRHDFLRQLQVNIARSVILMGQAAYVMRQHHGDKAFSDYIRELESSMRTRLFLSIDGVILPEDDRPDRDIAKLAAAAGAENQPSIEDDGRELIVVQRLSAPEGQSYVVVGLHRLGPPPGMQESPPPLRKPPPMGLGQGGPPPPEGKVPFSPIEQVEGVRILIFLLLTGLICSLLARSFSAPLARLRAVSRRIAAGQLSARVGTSLGKPGNEIGDLARDFDHMAERMEGLVNGRKRLLRDISHELRSPLTRLNLALELARKRFQADDDGNLQRIAKESARLNDLIGQLLDLTRSEGYTLDAQAPPVLLADLVLEIAEDVDFETRDRGKGVKIFELEALAVTGSRELLRQAIENIVRNGAYYTRTDSRVEVGLFSRQDSETGQTSAVIRVRDHGPGVPEDTLPHITEPFYRVAEARDRNSGGTGLGLAIAHQAVRQHGGSLRFANAPDRDGLIVEISLPLPGTLPQEIGRAPV